MCKFFETPASVQERGAALACGSSLIARAERTVHDWVEEATPDEANPEQAKQEADDSNAELGVTHLQNANELGCEDGTPRAQGSSPRASPQARRKRRNILAQRCSKVYGASEDQSRCRCK